jgi:two-component system, NarL family, nitrate/nitrite response regulator NarL
VSIRVVVIGQDPLARAGLVALVSRRDELLVVGQGSADEALRLARAADVVLWDSGSSPLTLDADDGAAAHILVLTSDEREAAQALAEGARGVLPREVSADRLVMAVSAVHEGLLVIDDSFSDALGVRHGPVTRLAEPLTSRELQVLALLSEGLSNKAIASRLEISESTAKFHVAAILGKLGVGSRAEAIVQAARLGLVVL